MARRVFFSFHYDRDVRRIVQVRNSWVVRREGDFSVPKTSRSKSSNATGGVQKPNSKTAVRRFALR